MFPVDQPPIENGIIEMHDGRIVRLGSGPDSDAEDLGKVAIIPGLVNAHTHLEFSDIARPLSPARPFVDWIRNVVAARRTSSGSSQHAIARGLKECARAGSTLVGEIETDDVAVMRFGTGTPGGVVFRELIGISEEAAGQQLAIARQHLAGTSDRDSSAHADHPAVIRGLSPHAPYSVAAEFLKKAVELAADANAPVAMHLAETPEELQLLRSGTGPFVDLLKDFGVWRDRFWMKDGTIESYLDVLSHAPRALVVHGNYLTAAEIAFLAQHPQMTVVYCPRTHAYFGHPEHPWRSLLEHGASVALGTDSRASNPDLSLWAEVVHLHQHCDAPAETLLELATRSGAMALGRGEFTGTLTAGKAADLAVVAFCDDALAIARGQPTDALLHPGNRVIAAMCGGRWIHRSTTERQLA